MKGRPFLAVVLAVVLLSFSLGLGGWWLIGQRGPLQLAHQPLAIPRAARFVPVQAPLSLYWFSDGEQPVAYARAVAAPRRRAAAGEAIARLRDGAFAAAGLDYRQELSQWLAPGMALVLLDESPEASPKAAGGLPAQAAGGLPTGGWLLVLASRDQAGARHFLQRFWQTRSLAGTDLQVSSYRGMGLISGRGALVGSRSVPLATALVQDDLVLIASGRGVLERALDVSQISELNQASQAGLQRELDRLEEGAALLLARPQALEHWLGWPLPAAPAQRPTQLVAALRPEGRSLVIHGHLQLPAPDPDSAEPAPLQPVDPDQQQLLLAGLRGPLTSLLLLQNPAAQLQQPLLLPLLQGALANTIGDSSPPEAAERGLLSGSRGELSGVDLSPLPVLVAQRAAGPLLLAAGPRGWQLGTAQDQPEPALLEPALAAQGLIEAPLQLGDRDLQVWTRLEARSPRSTQAGGSGEMLTAPLAAWRQVSGSLAWWGRSLALLEAPADRAGSQALLASLLSLNHADSPLQWVLTGLPTRQLLQAWQPWRLLSVLAGGGLDGSLQSLAVALEPEGRTLHLQARLSFER